MSDLQLSHPTGHLKGRIALPRSKSESNRMLILQALSRGQIKVLDLSTARDTVTMEKLLRENPAEMNVGHAGTAMRFLTAYLAFRPQDKVLTDAG